jgi:phospholipase/carboxylesterase
MVRLLALVATLVALAAAGSAGGTGADVAQTCKPGVHTLQLGSGRPARMRVTAGTGRKALVVVLHGAGGSAADGLRAFSTWTAPGLVLVAPASKGSTWSALRGTDADLATVNAALARAYARCRIDSRRIAIGGFSDGATYALSLGVASGDLFRSVVAFSPGGIVGGAGQAGRPRFFVSHGTRDPILPIGRTSNAIVRQLRDAGYPVTYRRFGGGHEIPRDVGKAAQRWFLSG